MAILRLYCSVLYLSGTLWLAAQEAPEMLPVSKGTFFMGCTEEHHLAIIAAGYPDGCLTGEPFYFSKETPVHRVEVLEFEMGKYEVTQKQWLAIMANLAPSGTPYFEDCGPDCPVEHVSWYDALVFCNRLTLLQHPVGLRNPNELGFHDMSGNVWEWCWDWFAPTYYRLSPYSTPTGPETGTTRVVRGGAWPNEAVLLRTACRNVSLPRYRFALLGFCLARTP